MKKLIALSALAVLVAAGCASHQTNRGGSSDTTGTSTDYNNGAIHPGTALGTNPSEDSDTSAPAPEEANPQEENSSDNMELEPEPASPDESSPDQSSPGEQRPDRGPNNHGTNEDGPGNFNVRHTILMIPI